MTDQIEEVKQKTDIVTIIGEKVTLKKAGRNYKGLCPFHSEKTPSFMVSPELQIFKCFGCQKAGDVFTFLKESEGMEFAEALKYLADRAGIKLRPLHPSQVGVKDHYYQINSLVKNFYHYVLLQHPAGKRALAYLTRERGLKVETINKFELGFSPKVSTPLVSLLTKKKKILPEDLIRVGLVYPRGQGLEDRFAGRVIFPLFDHRGNAVGFAGRVLPGEEGEMGKYINSPETPIYQKSKLFYGLNLTREAIKREKEAVVVEGELDLISSYQAGITNVVAIKGTALTPEQVDLLARFTPKVILALDADLAGDVAARRGIITAFAKGLELKVARLKAYKDPDEAARGNPEEYRRILNQAVDVWDFLLDQVFAKGDVTSGGGKAKLSRELTPLLSSIGDKIVQAHYVNTTAERLGVPPETVYAQMEQSEPLIKTDLSSATPVSQEISGKTRRELLEERLMALLFVADPKGMLKPEVKDVICSHLGQRLLTQLAEYLKQHTSLEVSDFASCLPPELFAAFSEMMFLDDGQIVQDESHLTKETETIKREITILDVKKKLEQLTEEIRSLEKLGGDGKLKLAEKQFSELSKKLSSFEESEP